MRLRTSIGSSVEDAASRDAPPTDADLLARWCDCADRDALEAVGLDDPWELTGLYHGRPLSEQSIWTTGEMPPMITLYRAPLLREWRETGVALDDLVTHVIVHEVGHHFGLSDDDMEAIEAKAEEESLKARPAG